MAVVRSKLFIASEFFLQNFFPKGVCLAAHRVGGGPLTEILGTDMTTGDLSNPSSFVLAVK